MKTRKGTTYNSKEISSSDAESDSSDDFRYSALKAIYKERTAGNPNATAWKDLDKINCTSLSKEIERIKKLSDESEVDFVVLNHKDSSSLVERRSSKFVTSNEGQDSEGLTYTEILRRIIDNNEHPGSKNFIDTFLKITFSFIFMKIVSANRNLNSDSARLLKAQSLYAFFLKLHCIIKQAVCNACRIKLSSVSILKKTASANTEPRSRSSRRYRETCRIKVRFVSTSKKIVLASDPPKSKKNCRKRRHQSKENNNYTQKGRCFLETSSKRSRESKNDLKFKKHRCRKNRHIWTDEYYCSVKKHYFTDHKMNEFGEVGDKDHEKSSRIKTKLACKIRKQITQDLMSCVFNCPICPVYDIHGRNNKITRNMLKRHCNSIEFQCLKCPMKISIKAHYKQHRYLHAQKFKTSCCICEKQFETIKGCQMVFDYSLKTTVKRNHCDKK